MDPPESTWTRRHASCAHPEFWHAADGESTETEVATLIAAFVRALQPDLVVETGSAFGYTTERIGRALERNAHGHCESLEPDQERARIARKRCGSLPVTILERSSLDYEPPGPIDLLFSDSAYEVRRAEVERLSRWMERGAIVLIHDTTSAERGHHVDMRAEVRALEGAGLLRAIYLPTPRGLAIAQVL
jgi:predicted O-methyltransferase YrrM